jgi:pimeloyl-ACP methyl ester carboxylesterase
MLPACHLAEGSSPSYLQQMRADEIRDAGALLGTTLDDVAVIAKDVHSAVATRLFGLLGKPAEPIRLMHDGIAALAYGATRAGVRYLPAAAGVVAGAVRHPAAPSIHDHPGGEVGLSALHGWMGDRIALRRPALTTPLRIRTHDGALRRVAANVAHDAADTATGRLVLFVHGLGENSRMWRADGYGSKLRDDDAWTPLYVSYNTGLPTAENGRLLAEHIDELAAAWPVPVTEIALVGHSMGGLVVRSAAAHAAAEAHGWVRALRRVVSLGTPHFGAPLEDFAAWGARTLNVLPETRPFATLINSRSAGIKDMAYRTLAHSEFAAVAEHVPGVGYYAVGATLTRTPMGRLDPIGDLLVCYESATGEHWRKRIPFDATMHVGRRTHFHLLTDAAVYGQLRTWLAAA